MKWNKLNEEQKKEVAFKRLSKSKSYVWAITLLTWLGVVSFFAFYIFKNTDSSAKSYEIVLRVLYLVCMSFFLLHIIHDSVRLLGLFLTDNKYKKFYEIVEKINIEGQNSKVLLLYCTFNDFMERALEKSIQQDYHNFEVIILDDSTNLEYRNKVDNFAKKNNIQVVRRNNRQNFKAGALNNYLLKIREKGSYDFFVVMDSDDILPSDYIVESLKCFHINEKIAAVQASNIAASNRNLFMKAYGKTQNLFTILDIKSRARFGNVFEVGHSVMMKRESYELVGGFPENVLLEDVAISFELNLRGYKILRAQHIVCKEESLVNFAAFKKRTSRWTRGDVGLFKKYFFKILFSRKIKWHEKIDVIRAPFLASIASIVTVFLITTLTLSAVLGVSLFIDKIFLLLFLLPIFFPFLLYIYHFKFNKNFFKAFFEILIFLFITTASFSTYLFSSFFGLFNRKIVFNVTPKEYQKITFLEAIKINMIELILGSIIFGITIFLSVMFNIFLMDFGILVVLSISMILSPIICFLSNIKYDEKIVEKENIEIVKTFKN